MPQHHRPGVALRLLDYCEWCDASVDYLRPIRVFQDGPEDSVTGATEYTATTMCSTCRDIWKLIGQSKVVDRWKPKT